MCSKQNRRFKYKRFKYNLITGTNESIMLTKHVSCKCECKNPKKHRVCKKIKIICGILLHVVMKIVYMLEVLLMIQ